MICLRCSGSGQVLGNGLIIDDCKTCKGVGKIYDKQPLSEDSPIQPSVDKRSRSYKAAIKEIQSVNKEMTLKDAENLFDKIYKKQG